MRVRLSLKPGLLASVILLVSASLSLAEDDPSVAVELVPAGVHQVNSGGYWSDDETDGFYRVIVMAGGVEHVSHRLFVQWVWSDESPPAYTVVRTVEIKELDLGPGHLLDVTTSFGDFDAFKIAVTSRDRAGKEKSFMIIAKGVGQYEIHSN